MHLIKKPGKPRWKESVSSHSLGGASNLTILVGKGVLVALSGLGHRGKALPRPSYAGRDFRGVVPITCFVFVFLQVSDGPGRQADTGEV